MLIVQKQTPPEELDWKKWLVVALARGVTVKDVHDMIIQCGISSKTVIAEIEEAQAHPYFKAAVYLGQKLEKSVGMHEVYSDLFRQSPSSQGIPEVSRITPRDFFENYYYVNRPVLLRDFVSHWPAIGKWDPAFLAQEVGDQFVDVCIGRNADDQYEENIEDHITEVNFADFVHEVVTRSPTNDIYLVARNFAFGRPGMAKLKRDIELPRGIIEDSDDHRNIKFWFGPAGTITPLHHDCNNILFAQVYGRKRFTMFPSFDLDMMQNRVGVMSDIDPENLDAFPTANGRRYCCMTVDVGLGTVCLFPMDGGITSGHWTSAFQLRFKILPLPAETCDGKGGAGFMKINSSKHSITSAPIPSPYGCPRKISSFRISINV